MESHFPHLPAPHQSQLARERVIDDVRTLVADGELLLKATAGDLSRSAAAARERLSAMLERARGFLVEAQRQGAVVISRADTVVRENPWSAVAAAFGTGLVIGAAGVLWASRRRHRSALD